jgi:hypothetical protein
MDKTFKIGLLVLGFCYLAYLFCPFTSQKGRYQYHEGRDAISVFDTTTGVVYRMDGEYLLGRSEFDIVAWAKDMAKLESEELQKETKKIIEKLRKEGIEVEETN